MLAMLRQTSYLAIAVLLHIVVLFIFIFSYEFSSPLIVFENTNQRDVISAVVLGDSLKSKILPHNPPPPPPVVTKKIEETPPPKVAAKQTVVPQKKDVVALKPPEKKLKTKKAEEDITKALLADIKKHKDKPKKIVQKSIKTQFEKTLKQQAEKTLRQQLMDEDIKITSEQIRRAQGIVRKYEALIKQAISNHWIVPTGVNKHLRCKLNIRVAPGGMVTDVQVAKSSGDLALDHSARAAVFNASPLPVPTDPKMFDQFRVFEMDVSPKDIISGV